MMETINSLPIIENPDSELNGYLIPKFWRYYLPPFNQPIFFDMDDPYNDLITIFWGPRGGGKTISAVGMNIVDGMMRGKEVISNVPISWVAEDSNHKEYLVKSIPFDIEQFESGDPSLKYKNLLLDEGNYLADSKRAMSNNNMGIMDILQQARKFRMSVTFCTINCAWLESRLTNSLADIIIECNDLFYKPYGKKHGLKKGDRVCWDIMDQSGKVTGKQFNPIASTTFFSRLFFLTYDTEYFVSPQELRRKRNSYDSPKLLPMDGQLLIGTEWDLSLRNKIKALAQQQDVWTSKDLYDTLPIEGFGLRKRAGTIIRNIEGVSVKDGRHGAIFNLSGVERK